MAHEKIDYKHDDLPLSNMVIFHFATLFNQIVYKQNVGWFPLHPLYHYHLPFKDHFTICSSMRQSMILWMEEILHQLRDGLSHYL